MPLYGGSALACACYTLGLRSLFKLLGGVAFVVGGVRFRDTVTLPRSLAELSKYYDFDTELGRETGGLTILLTWFAIMVLVDDWQTEKALKEASAKGPKDGKSSASTKAPGTSTFELLLIVLAGGVLLSTYIIPKYIMRAPPAEDYCQGVGFSVPTKQ